MSEKIDLIVAEMTESRRVMMEEFSKTNNKIDMVDKKLDPLTTRLDNVEIKVENNSKKIESCDKEMEREKRKRNVIIFGIEVDEEENYLSLEEKVRNLIREKMNITILSTEVDSIRRFGNVQNNKRPIIMSLTTWKRKMELISNGRHLKGTGIIIKEDFPKEVQQIRKALYDEMMEHRRNGRKAFIKYDKLIVDGIEMNEKQQDEEVVEMMEEDTEKGGGNEKGKRKADTAPGQEMTSSKDKPVIKKMLSHTRSHSATRLVLNQSKLDAFVNNINQEKEQKKSEQQKE